VNGPELLDGARRANRIAAAAPSPLAPNPGLLNHRKQNRRPTSTAGVDFDKRADAETRPSVPLSEATVRRSLGVVQCGLP
jgi:hypothetical protein